MRITSDRFRENVERALGAPNLKLALDRTTGLLRTRRAEVIAAYPEFEAAREAARQIKDHTIRYLDHYLETFEQAAWRRAPKSIGRRRLKRRAPRSSPSAGPTARRG
ncbi:MAG: hypothetical protein ACE5DS_02455 [Kiloniellaceae bacterium]